VDLRLVSLRSHVFVLHVRRRSRFDANHGRHSHAGMQNERNLEWLPLRSQVKRKCIATSLRRIRRERRGFQDPFSPIGSSVESAFKKIERERADIVAHFALSTLRCGLLFFSFNIAFLSLVHISMLLRFLLSRLPKFEKEIRSILNSLKFKLRGGQEEVGKHCKRKRRRMRRRRTSTTSGSISEVSEDVAATMALTQNPLQQITRAEKDIIQVEKSSNVKYQATSV